MPHQGQRRDEQQTSKPLQGAISLQANKAENRMDVNQTDPNHRPEGQKTGCSITSTFTVCVSILFLRLIVLTIHSFIHSYIFL